jgi:hypothetical protein
MHVTVRRAGAVALLAAGGALLSSACVRNESSLFIRSCLAVPRDTCTVQASTNSAFISDGVIDAAYVERAEYVCSALIENQLVARGDPTKLRTETSRINLYQAEVQVLDDDPTSPSAFAQYTVPVSGFADPGNGTEPGLGITDIVMIDAKTLADLGQRANDTGKQQLVVASVVLHGRTLGGLEVESNEFRFPITVTKYSKCIEPIGDTCLFSTQLPTPDCLQGQDARVDCRLLKCYELACDVGETTGHCPANDDDLKMHPCPCQ